MNGGSTPVARFVAVEPVDVHVLDAIRTEWLERVSDLDGHLGGLLLVDRAASSVIGISFWSDLDALHATDALADRIVAGVEAILSADNVRLGTCDILVNQPMPVVIPAPEVVA